MFIASVIICAAITPSQIIEDRCIALQDTKGPYQTKEICQARTDEMEEIIQNDPQMIAFLMSSLGRPPGMATRGICDPAENGEVAV